MSYNGLKKKKMADGTILYYARAFGEWVEVSKEVFAFMATNHREMRRIRCKDFQNGVISLEELTEKSESHEWGINVPLELTSQSPEELYLKRMGESSAQQIDKIVKEQIELLGGVERVIATSIIINGLTIEQCSDECGLSPATVSRRLRSIRKMLHKNCMEVLHRE